MCTKLQLNIGAISEGFRGIGIELTFCCWELEKENPARKEILPAGFYCMIVI